MTAWQTYIGQADTHSERFYRIQRLTQAYSDRVQFFASHRYYAKAWLKYVSNLVSADLLYRLVSWLMLKMFSSL